LVLPALHKKLYKQTLTQSQMTSLKQLFQVILFNKVLV